MEGLFKNTLNDVENEGFVHRNKIGETSFSRNRKLTFKDLIFSMIGFTRPSVQTELDRFYKALSSSRSFESISKSAFTQSRKKLKPEAFKELNTSQLNYFAENAPFQKRWKGKRIIAIDGALLNLPHAEDIEDSFGSVTNQHDKIVSARASFAYDVGNELVIDAEIAPRRSCEKDLAIRHLSSLNPQTDILVFDRGYPCQWLMGRLSQLGFGYCFRLSSAWKKAHHAVKEQKDVDWTLERDPSREWGKLKKFDLPRTLGGLRLLSFTLANEEQEVLLTNLSDRDSFSYEEMKALYKLRWGVEESFKSFKKTLHIEHFSGRSAVAVRQDFHARVFMLNMASMVRTQGTDPENSNNQVTKYHHKTNKTQTLAKIKDFLVDLFYKKTIRPIIKQLLKILRKRKDIIRPNRSFERPKVGSRRRHKITNSKGI